MQKYLCHLRNIQSHVHQFLGMGKNLRRRGVHRQVGTVQHQQTVRHCSYILHGVTDHHDGSIFSFSITFDITQDFRAANGVQSRRGFIKNQNFRLHGNHTGNCHTALLSAGKIKRRHLKLLIRDANKAGCFPHPAVDFLRTQSHILGAESDILVHRLLKKLVFRVLEHQAHPKARLASCFLVRPNVYTIQQNLSGGGLQQTIQLLHQCGFTGAGMTDDTHKFSTIQ